MEKSEAIAIAERFLRQHHSNMLVKKSVLSGNVWSITFDVTNITQENKTLTIEVDAYTGKIVVANQKSKNFQGFDLK